MKLQARFLLLFMALFAIIAVLVGWQQWFEKGRVRTLLENSLAEHKAYFAQIKSLDGQTLLSLSVDYSFWDEMVNFVTTGNQQFARDTIDAGLANYSADAAWVYKPDRTLAYYSAVPGTPDLRDLNLHESFFAQLHNYHFAHFFQNTPAGLMEFRAATIHPGDDDERRTEPKGYWVVGRLWDDEQLTHLGQITQSRITVGSASDSTGDELKVDRISFGQSLTGASGDTAAILRVSSAVPIISGLVQAQQRQLYLLVTAALATMLLLIGSLWAIVLAPLLTLTRSLQDIDRPKLVRLAKADTEFGRLARLIERATAAETKLGEAKFVKSQFLRLLTEKSQFLATAAHELKSSAGATHVMLAHLADRIEAGAPSSDLQFETQRLSHQNRKLTVLINDVYQASKGGDVLLINKSSFDFDEFIRELVADAQLGIKQHITISGFTAAHVSSDRDRLGQVINNLLTNAAKFSPVAQQIRIVLRRDGQTIITEIQDDGLGVADNEHDKIFERFYRSPAVAGKYPGLGVGLSLCRDLVTSLGGKIWYTSRLGHGSQFYVSLPLDDLL